MCSRTVRKLAFPQAGTRSRADNDQCRELHSCSLVTSKPADEWQRWVSLWRVEVSDCRCAQSMISETRWGRAQWLGREQDRKIRDNGTASFGCSIRKLISLDRWLTLRYKGHPRSVLLWHRLCCCFCLLQIHLCICVHLLKYCCHCVS